MAENHIIEDLLWYLIVLISLVASLRYTKRHQKAASHKLYHKQKNPNQSPRLEFPGVQEIECSCVLGYNPSATHKSHKYKPYSLIFSNNSGVDFVRSEGKREYRILQHNCLMKNTADEGTYTPNHINFHNKVFVTVWQFLFSGLGPSYLKHYVFPRYHYFKSSD